MPLEIVFLLLGFALLSAILVAAVCSVLYPEARSSVREWINTLTSIVTLFVLAWTARSIVEQVTEMQKVYPEIQSQARAMIDQTNSFIATERARVSAAPTGEVQRNGENDPTPGFRVRIMNLGRTAALVRGMLIQCDISPLESLRNTPSYDEARLKWTASPIMGESVNPTLLDQVCHPSQPLSDDDLAGLKAKPKSSSSKVTFCTKTCLAKLGRSTSDCSDTARKLL
jgi:hypothetical protein